MDNKPLVGGLLQRRCACGKPIVAGGECVECRKKRRLQRYAVNSPQSTAVPPIVYNVLRAPGRPLDEGARSFMESRLGHDFSGVRVHTDAQAAESSRSVGALAYTVESNIVFGRGHYAPATNVGRHLLAHELAHVVQQRSFRMSTSSLHVDDATSSLERKAEQSATDVTTENKEGESIQPAGQANGILQRFSTSEHVRIGNEAYAQARPQDQPASATEAPLPLNELFLARSRTSASSADRIVEMTYGQLVAVADNITSFLALEERDRARAQTRVPVLSRIWDWIGDQAHYVDLAARNIQHFHPHNWRSWQQWHWEAVNQMSQAYQGGQELIRLKGEVNSLLQQFDQHYQRGRAAILQADRLPQGETSAEQQTALQRTIKQETANMQRILETLRPNVQNYQTKRQEVRDRAVRAVAINGFGDHFLTDAFSAGHIITPRQELLNEYRTRLFGVFNVSGVLECANIPSLAWHDLDNRFGVYVDNVEGNSWLAFGDDYADEGAIPGGSALSPTMAVVVEATRRSIQQVWATAAGNRPTSLLPVLNLIPRPNLSPERYPNWGANPADTWDRQLRYAAGEAVGETYDVGLSGSSSREDRPRESVPNPKGNQVGSGLLSARATCLNVRSEFSYHRFVVPMVERLRRDYEQRYFSGRAEQIVPPTATPRTQESIRGNVITGSIIGGILGAAGGIGLGLLIGGGIGGVVGGIVGTLLGFLVGGLIGGLIGGRRQERPAV